MAALQRIMRVPLASSLAVALVSVALAQDGAGLIVSPGDTMGETAGMAVSRDTLSVPAADTTAALSRTAAPDSAAARTDTIGAVPAASDTVTPAPLDSRQRGAIHAALKKKRQAVIAGGSLLALGVLIDYALVMPAAADMEATDLEGQLALISPQLLAFGLRVAGPSIAAMRTSEVKDVWKRNTGRAAPRCLGWTLDFCGWGFYAASSACGMIGVMDSTSSVNWDGWSLAMGITADVVWAGTVAYAWWYLASIGHAADAGVAEPPKVTVAPSVNRAGAPGLALVVRF